MCFLLTKYVLHLYMFNMFIIYLIYIILYTFKSLFSTDLSVLKWSFVLQTYV